MDNSYTEEKDQPDIVRSVEESLLRSTASNNVTTDAGEAKYTTSNTEASTVETATYADTMRDEPDDEEEMEVLPDLEQDIQKQFVKHCGIVEDLLESPNVEADEIISIFEITIDIQRDIVEEEVIQAQLGRIVERVTLFSIGNKEIIKCFSKFLELLASLSNIHYPFLADIVSSKDFNTWIEYVLFNAEDMAVHDTGAQFLIKVFAKPDRELLLQKLESAKTMGNLVGTLILLYRYHSNKDDATTLKDDDPQGLPFQLAQCILYCRPAVAMQLMNEKSCCLWIGELNKTCVDVRNVISYLGVVHTLVRDMTEFGRLLAFGIHVTIHKVLRTFSDEKIVLNLCMDIIEELCNIETVFTYYRENKLSQDLNDIINFKICSKPADENLLCMSIRLYSRLIMYESVERKQLANFLYTVNSVLEKHSEEKRLQNTCVQTLIYVLPLLKENMKVLGDENNQIGLPKTLMGVLLTHGPVPQMFLSVCHCLSWLLKYPHIKQYLGSRNIHIALVAFINQMPEDSTRYRTLGYRALRSLCEDNANSADKIIVNGLLPNVTPSDEITLLDSYFQNAFLEYFATLCLESTQLIPAELLECVRSQVQNIMLDNITEDNAIAKCLHVLYAIDWKSFPVMSAATEHVEKDPVRIGILLSIMDTCKTNATIQIRCLRILQFELSESNVEASHILCQHAIESVCASMLAHKTNVEVLEEALVLIYLLAKHSRFISQVLVESAILEQLLIQNLTMGLRNIAHLCLFILACHRDLKAKILQLACKLDQPIAAACMIALDADVTMGEAAATPLAHACRIGNIALVRLLLSRGIGDVMTPLSIATELGHYDIAGVLLQYITQDQQEGTVDCSALDLPSLRKEWLLPVLSNRRLVEMKSVTSLQEKGRAMASSILAMCHVFSETTRASTPDHGNGQSVNTNRRYLHPENPFGWDIWTNIPHYSSELDLSTMAYFGQVVPPTKSSII